MLVATTVRACKAFKHIGVPFHVRNLKSGVTVLESDSARDPVQVDARLTEAIAGTVYCFVTGALRLCTGIHGNCAACTEQPGSEKCRVHELASSFYIRFG